jgi:hypothetical protein
MTVVFRGAISTAEDRADNFGQQGSPIEREVLKHRGALPAGAHPSITATAVVNHGRWIVPCPWCFSAQMASRSDRRFFCVECGNAGAGGMWVRVVWPPAFREIEALLCMRPDPRNRSWLANETLADLLAENQANGVI